LASAGLLLGAAVMDSGSVVAHAATSIEASVTAADVCPPLRGLPRLPVGLPDRQLQGGEIRAANVASGSIAVIGLRTLSYRKRCKASQH